MIFKVYYQEKKNEVPVRENTRVLYTEAGSEREVRHALKSRPYNIEFVQKVANSFLEYEKQSPNYKVEQL
ncbi:DNA-dependent RNA polymerase auxiliary subunit epsilon [Bacillus ectoiniformans]|uniref:DNA-dependent RNA polymerase subunit epsilon n=1 Tax=Bacillus ectoiniformans TaxID=1494429 RepID=UPI001957EBC7|nr:DNA-directed RNA polymerase subunit epsilon [Bacillus ectoiniformans]MBM7647287.1 DNA-dependent RNA polymerase auxiliary subunit epsilon [Bacillus ectoiniformans]